MQISQRRARGKKHSLSHDFVAPAHPSSRRSLQGRFAHLQISPKRRGSARENFFTFPCPRSSKNPAQYNNHARGAPLLFDLFYSLLTQKIPFRRDFFVFYIDKSFYIMYNASINCIQEYKSAPKEGISYDNKKSAKQPA